MHKLPSFIPTTNELLNAFTEKECAKDHLVTVAGLKEQIKKRKKKVWKTLKWKRTYKIHFQTLLKVCGNRKDFEIYHLFINLHSIYNQKIIFNYRSRIPWLANQTGITQRKCKQLLNELIEKGFLRIDFNSHHLQIKSKTYVLTHFGTFQQQGSMPIWASKFDTIEFDGPITINQLKTVALQYKQSQKRYAYLDREFNLTRLEKKSKIQLPNEQLKAIQLYCRKSLANFNPSASLYLNEIQKLFGYTNKSSASRLLTSLQKDHLIVKHHRFQLFRPIHHELDGVKNNGFESKGYFRGRNDNIYRQVANRFFFNSPFHIKIHWAVRLMDRCEKRLHQKEKEYKKDMIQRLQRWIKSKSYTSFDYQNIWIREEFYDSTGVCCGTHTFMEKRQLKASGAIESKRICGTSIQFQFPMNISQSSNGYIVRYEKDGMTGNDEWKIVSPTRINRNDGNRNLTLGKLSGLAYILMKRKSDDASLKNILWTMDQLSPMRGNEIGPIAGQDNND